MTDTVTIPKAHYEAFVALKEAVEYEETHRSINGGMFLALEEIARTEPKPPDLYDVLDRIITLLDWAKMFIGQDADNWESLRQIASAWENSGEPEFYASIFSDARSALDAHNKEDE